MNSPENTLSSPGTTPCTVRGPIVAFWKGLWFGGYRLGVRGWGRSGSGFGFGVRVLGLGLRVYLDEPIDIGFIPDWNLLRDPLPHRTRKCHLRVSGSGFGFRVSFFGFKVQGLGYRVQEDREDEDQGIEYRV